MANVRDIVKDKSNSNGDSWTARLSKFSSKTFSISFSIVQWSYANARVIGWFVVTTGVITLLPLIFEVN